MVLVSFRVGVIVSTGGFMKVVGEFFFKLIFFRVSVIWRGFWGVVFCCLREFSIFLVFCIFFLIRNRVFFCKSFFRVFLIFSLSRVFERLIFCRVLNFCWKAVVRVGWLRRFCCSLIRDRIFLIFGLVLSL